MRPTLAGLPTNPGWRHFSKQAAALEHAALDPQDQVWSIELDQGNGSRSYIVASREAFWLRYRAMHPPTPRHYYEVIRADQPCHCYFDLEFCRIANPESNGEQMVRILCNEVRTALEAHYGKARPIRIVDLESSTPRKFSRHVVVRMDGAAFSNNREAGRFVCELLSSLKERRANEPMIASLFVAPPQAGAPRKPSAATQVCFIDGSVYTRNRCFRICTLLGPKNLATYVHTPAANSPSHNFELSLES